MIVCGDSDASPLAEAHQESCGMDRQNSNSGKIISFFIFFLQLSRNKYILLSSPQYSLSPGLPRYSLFSGLAAASVFTDHYYPEI
jgi:hypothetical protein